MVDLLRNQGLKLEKKFTVIIEGAVNEVIYRMISDIRTDPVKFLEEVLVA